MVLALALELDSVPQSRLLNLLGMALNYQKQKGLLPPTPEFNLFTNATKLRKESKELYPRDVAKSIKVSYLVCMFHIGLARYAPEVSQLGTSSVWLLLRRQIWSDLVV